jgi:hypothetical protein
MFAATELFLSHPPFEPVDDSQLGGPNSFCTWDKQNTRVRLKFTSFLKIEC